MIEMPRNVAKCLLFRNVLHEKLIGEEKALLIYLFWKIYISQHPFFPLGRQILNEKIGSLDSWFVCIQISVKFFLKAKITKKFRSWII